MDESDPRVARTRRDVVAATTALLLSEGWERVTHAAVARSSGYAKATVYSHWPTQLDLVRDAIDRICDEADHPPVTGDLRADLVAGLRDFAADLSSGELARVLGAVVERFGSDPEIERLRTRLYETGTAGLRAAVTPHVAPARVEVLLAQLTGAVFVRVAFEGKPASAAFIDALVDQVASEVHPPGLEPGTH